MNDDQITAQRAYWNQAWEHPPPRPVQVVAHEHWLSTLLEPPHLPSRARLLEIGCGDGDDTRYLLAQGYHVIALDLSRIALRHVAALAPTVQVVEAALPAPLPFVARGFSVVVAGLSLHYFRHADTTAIVAEIRRVLRPGGVLVFRVNAVGDVGSGYGHGREVEPNLFLRNGHYKRFFAEADCRALFEQGWELEILRPQVVPRYDRSKHTWAGRARRW